MSITISDIAKKARASVSTVSRVLNNKAGKHRISKQTEKRILKAAKELRYKPNQLARGLRLKKTHTIGLILPDISNPFFAYVTRSIQTNAHRMGYSLVVCDTDEDVSLEIEHIDLLKSKGVDGFIIMAVGQASGHIEALVKESVSLVLVDRCFENLKTNSVVVDNYNGAFEGIEHLIMNGHTRIGIIQGLPGTYSSTGRLKGYKDALAKHGIGIHSELIGGSGFRRETGYEETKRLLRLSNPPTAIFATSDLICLGALEALYEEGYKIPQDISLIAFDDIDFAPFLQCPLTAVVQPKEQMGEIAVKLLIDQMKSHNKKPAETIILKPTLVKRKSVQNISIEEKALAFED